IFFFSSRRRHTSSKRDWSSDVCSSDLVAGVDVHGLGHGHDGRPPVRLPGAPFDAADDVSGEPRAFGEFLLCPAEFASACPKSGAKAGNVVHVKPRSPWMSALPG